MIYGLLIEDLKTHTHVYHQSQIGTYYPSELINEYLDFNPLMLKDFIINQNNFNHPYDKDMIEEQLIQMRNYLITENQLIAGYLFIKEMNNCSVNNKKIKDDLCESDELLQYIFKGTSLLDRGYASVGQALLTMLYDATLEFIKVKTIIIDFLNHEAHAEDAVFDFLKITTPEEMGNQKMEFKLIKINDEIHTTILLNNSSALFLYDLVKLSEVSDSFFDEDLS